LGADAELALIEPGERAMTSRDLEDSTDFGTARSRAHGRGIRPIAERETERVDEDRFPCARLAGHDYEARLELDLYLVDERVVCDSN
jgi:hypothetical protein